jgi:hypothetical protein
MPNSELPMELMAIYHHLYYAYMSLTDVDASYNEQPGIAEGNMQTIILLWETNFTTNFGLDFSVKHLLDFSFEYYIRKTKNLLMDMPTSFNFWIFVLIPPISVT